MGLFVLAAMGLFVLAATAVAGEETPAVPVEVEVDLTSSPTLFPHCK